MRDYLETGRDEKTLRKMFPHLCVAQVQACLLYYSKHPDEIEDAIEQYRGLTWEAVQARLGTLARRG